LPFNDLSWENFERLCLRLIETNADVEHCQLYGDRGQDQQGIDIYARSRTSRAHVVYQCKKYAKLARSHIRSSVSEFLKGKWSNAASTFVFCTSHHTTDRKIADEIEAQAKRLKKKGVTFRLWHRDSLSSLLKQQSLIVDDFFGRQFVAAFCGDDIAASILNRLDAKQIVEYRQKLREFYHHVFLMHDPAIPFRGELGLGRVELAERYVLPELNIRIAPISSPIENASQESGREEAAALGLREGKLPTGRSPKIQNFTPVTTRVAIDAWLSQGERSVILGGPGTGKSAFLRFLTLDLLSDDPALERLARWADAIPVWIPFPFWTSLIADGVGRDSSLVDCLRSWFEQWGELQLWPLVELAIEDQRLFVIVDGLDEWTSEEAGRIAAQKLQRFVEARTLPAVVVSRPYGYERLGFNGSSWQVSELAQLSHGQKFDLCRKWLSIWDQRKGNSRTELSVNVRKQSLAEAKTIAFLEELESSNSLSDLSSTPLLLLLLLGLHIEGTILPRNRFEAYEYVVNHLVRDHPIRKRVAAMTGLRPGLLTETELHNAFAYIAYFAQSQFPTGVLPEAEIRTALERFLTNDEDLGMGLSLHESNQHLERFLRFEEGSVGLLISPGHGRFNFLHRALQEYLAGTHLSRLNLTQQKDVLRSRSADPLWREVILALLSRTRRPEDVDELIRAVEVSKDVDLNNLARRELLAEVSCGEFNLTVALCREITTSICDEIESGNWLPHRKRLLAHALTGLNSNKVRTIINDRLKRWVFASAGRSWGIQGMTGWPATNETWSALALSLQDEETHVQRAAANTVAQVFHTNQDVLGMVSAIATKSLSPSDRAAALESAIKGWPQSKGVEDLLNSARAAEDPTIRAVAIYGRVMSGIHDDDDFVELAEMTKVREANRLDIWWRDIVADTFIRGWKGGKRLKDLVLANGLQDGFSAKSMERDVAERILVSAFPGDRDVALVIAAQLRKQFKFSGFTDVWETIAANFRDDPDIVAAVEAWSLQFEDGHQREFSLISTVGRTSTIKRKLIGFLDNWVPFWAASALLDGWGMSDPDVATALVALADQPPSRSSEIAHLIPRIITDPIAARKKLLDLMRSKDSRRHDFVIRGLSTLTDRGDEEEIVEACLAAISDAATASVYDMGLSALISGFSSDRRVREMAKSAITTREPPLRAVAEAYAADDEMRLLVRERLTPLPGQLRFKIAEELPAVHDPNVVLSVLKKWDHESDREIKTMASIGYHTVLSHSNEDQSQAVQRLDDCFPCYGPDYEARRQAAFPGLVLLKQLNILNRKRETIGFEGQDVAIPLERGMDSNLVLTDFIAGHWDEIKAVLGPSPAQWFTRPANEDQFFAVLSRVAPQYASLASDFRDLVSSNPMLARTAAGLSFTAKTNPRSSLLLQHCLAALSGPTDPHGWFDQVETAATLVAEHFSHDDDVGNKLVELMRQRGEIGPLMAVCLGWPSSPILDELFADFTNRNVRSLSELAEEYVLYTKAGANEFRIRLDKDVAAAAGNKYHNRGFLKPVLARMRRDNGIASHIYDVLRTSTSSNTRASYVGLLAESEGVGITLAEWCRLQIEGLKRQDSPELGYDVLLPGYRSILLCFLDALDRSELPGIAKDLN
jgi:hypothetical protein